MNKHPSDRDLQRRIDAERGEQPEQFRPGRKLREQASAEIESAARMDERQKLLTQLSDALSDAGIVGTRRDDLLKRLGAEVSRG